MKLLFILFTAGVLLCHGVFGVEEITVPLTERDVVTLHTGVKTNHQDRIRWYFNDIRIAQITGDLIKTCKDVQCKERFRDRLELDNQTGSLIIMKITNTDSGLYKLKILGNPSSEKIFNVTVHDQKKTVPVKERETVTLCTGLYNHPDDFMTWHFNNTLIVEANGHHNKICTDVQCEYADERFRDRLKLDHQTGSLIITNIRNTDSGEYKLQIRSSRFSIIRSFKVTVTDSHLETPAQDLVLYNMKVVCVSSVLLVLAVIFGFAVTCCVFKKHKLKR